MLYRPKATINQSDHKLSQPNYHSTSTRRSTSEQNFSSRNSLRAAQSADVKQRNFDMNITMMPYSFDSENVICDFNRRKILHSRYEVLGYNNDVFLKDIVGDRAFCVLCCKKVKRFKDDLEQHLESSCHQDKVFELRTAIYKQPFQESSLQLTAINELLKSWYKHQSLTMSDISKREYAIQTFVDVLSTFDQSCEVRLFGSDITGTALKTSDIDIELIHPNSEIFLRDPRAKNSIHHKLTDPGALPGMQVNNHVNKFDLIPNAVGTLFNLWSAFGNPHSDIHYFELESNYTDLNKKIPTLVLKHKHTGLRLKVSCYVEGSYRLSILLKTYLSLDQRACALSFLVKYWAKKCMISTPDNGSFPPDTFIILVIYFLQRISPPILPCLNEMMTKGLKQDSAANRLNNTIRSDGVNRVKLAENITKDPSDVIEEEVEDEEDEEFGYTELSTEDVNNLNWFSENTKPVYILFIEFMRIMMEEFNDPKKVISIATLKEPTVERKGWNTQIKAIENPVKPGANISRSIGSHRTFNYISACFKQCYYYLTCIPFDLHLKPKRGKARDPRDYTDLYINLDKIDTYLNLRVPKLIGRSISDNGVDTISEMIKQDIFEKDVEAILALKEKKFPGPPNIQKIVSQFYTLELLIPSDEASALFCWVCKKNGHLRPNCPSAKLENLHNELETYNHNLDLEANLDYNLIELFDKSKITPQRRSEYELAIRDLTKIINDALKLKCHLELFGSTVNDLGSLDSDLDICMTLSEYPTGEGVNCVEILKDVSVLFSKDPRISSLEPILTARVPIIRFKYKDHFDIDLSMYNQCAIYNSQLLKTYSSIDERVPMIFFLVKRFAKACGIADASKCTLSSYAWALLVIHYLQQIDPPILPVLQESKDGSQNTIGVNGWNVWFRSDIDNIRNEMQYNSHSLTFLFKGFFLYYGSFDFGLNVVSIRKSNYITRFQKNWHTCMMAIEDPFELTFNLGSRLDEQMGIHIINSFPQAYEHILSIQKELTHSNPVDSNELDRWLFNGSRLTKTAPPYRGCRLCHKIGHKVQDCPQHYLKNKKPPRKPKGSHIHNQAQEKAQNNSSFSRTGPRRDKFVTRNGQWLLQN